MFPYICTTQTSDPYIPPAASNTFQRDVSDAFAAIVGGYRQIGRIAFFPIQKAVPFHLLCDGKEIAKASFPELYDYLGDTQGTPVDPDNFMLPNYIGAAAFVPAATATPETVEAGTVTSETSSPGGGDSGGTINPAVDSGGRERYNTVLP